MRLPVSCSGYLGMAASGLDAVLMPPLPGMRTLTAGLLPRRAGRAGRRVRSVGAWLRINASMRLQPRSLAQPLSHRAYERRPIFCRALPKHSAHWLTEDHGETLHGLHTPNGTGVPAIRGPLA